MFEPLDRLDFDVALASTQRAHRRVLAAIAEGNAKMAERRMAAHLADSGREIAEVYAGARRPSCTRLAIPVSGGRRPG